MAPRTQNTPTLEIDQVKPGSNRIWALTDEEFQDVLLVAGCVRDVLPVSKFRQAYLDSREYGLPHKEALASLVTVKEPQTIQTLHSPTNFEETEWHKAVSKDFFNRGSRKPVYQPETGRVVDELSGEILATGVTRAQADKLWDRAVKK